VLRLFLEQKSQRSSFVIFFIKQDRAFLVLKV